MNMDITYEQAIAAYPKEAKEAIALLRKSRSKHRKADPATLKWQYNWSIEIRGCSTFAGLLDGTAAAEAAKRRAMGLKERIEDAAERTSVSITVAGYGARLHTVPTEIMRGIIDHQTERLSEEQKIDALSPEERAADVQRLLSQLQGPGFAAFTFPEG